MNRHADATMKRSILLGARIRFSPSGASVRNQAIERIIEQNLAAADAANGLTEQQLQNLVTLGGQLTVLRPSDVRQGIDSLKQSKRVLELTDGKKRHYMLSDNAKNDVKQIITESEERTTAAIRELFGHATGGEESYRRAFLRMLCLVFSQLSEVYVQVITMKQEGKDLTEHQLLVAPLKDVLKSERVPDADAFRYGVNRFFKESSPQFDQIKWNMAQNFYVAKALGIDAASDLLSSDMFRDASLYCDTNVLIAGLVPESRHHNSFRELAKACTSIEMNLKVTHTTLDELKGVISTHASLLKKVFHLIPDDTQPKVRSFLLEAFLTERRESPALALDDFIEHFQTPLQTLRDSFGLVEEDDQWFDSAPKDQNTRRLAKDLAKQYEEMRHRPKSERAAVHDAVLLLWVARENAESRESWIITLDITLSEWNNQHSKEGSKVITLDAFLQWMTPVVTGSADEDRLAGIFSAAIRYQILPRDTFFQLRDFQVFAEMGIETKQLPSDDVEACVREIRKVGPQLDPSKAADREKIGQVIQRYFADPGTKYQRTIHNLQAKTDRLSKTLDEEVRLRKGAEDKVSQLKEQGRDRDEKLRQESEALKAMEDRIATLDKTVKGERQKAYRNRLIVSVVLRTACALLLLVGLEISTGILIWQYGEGGNLFQKITKAWPWLGIGVAIVAILYPFIMGRERMRLLKWWKGDSDDKGRQQ